MRKEKDLIDKKFEEKSYPTDDTVLDAAVRLTLIQKYKENPNYDPSKDEDLDVDFALNYCLMYLKHKENLGYGSTFLGFVKSAMQKKIAAAYSKGGDKEEEIYELITNLNKIRARIKNMKEKNNGEKDGSI